MSSLSGVKYYLRVHFCYCCYRRVLMQSNCTHQQDSCTALFEFQLDLQGSCLPLRLQYSWLRRSVVMVGCKSWSLIGSLHSHQYNLCSLYKLTTWSNYHLKNVEQYWFEIFIFALNFYSGRKLFSIVLIE
jgi:hypothetical protein